MAVNDDICKKVAIIYVVTLLKINGNINLQFNAEKLILNNHLKYLDLISTERSGWHSTTYGINSSSTLSELKGFEEFQTAIFIFCFII